MIEFLGYSVQGVFDIISNNVEGEVESFQR